MNTRLATLLALLVALGASPVRAADEKPSAGASASISSSATVTAINAKQRLVTLKLADGSLADIVAGPAVRNFDQIKVGDQVIASAKDTVTIEVVPAGQAAPNVTGGSAITSAPKGAKPMAVLVDTAMVSGTVTAIDVEQRAVTVSGPAGNVDTIHVGPDVQHFDSLRLGDVVVVTLKSVTSLEVVTPARK